MHSNNVPKITTRISFQSLALAVSLLILNVGASNTSAESNQIVSPRDPQSGLPTGSTANSGKPGSGNTITPSPNNSTANKGAAAPNSGGAGGPPDKNKPHQYIGTVTLVK